jgi:hypothetical protein
LCNSDDTFDFFAKHKDYRELIRRLNLSHFIDKDYVYKRTRMMYREILSKYNNIRDVDPDLLNQMQADLDAQKRIFRGTGKDK